MVESRSNLLQQRVSLVNRKHAGHSTWHNCFFPRSTLHNVTCPQIKILLQAFEQHNLNRYAQAHEGFPPEVMYLQTAARWSVSVLN